jgi:hypothetical protein
MKKTWFIVLVALIVAAAVSLAEVSFAQPRGQGMGRRGQGTQAWCQGQGPGNPNCPYNQGYKNCPQGRANNPQPRRGRRWNQPANPPAPQSTAPEAAQ